MRRNPARGASVGGLVPSGDVKRICVARGVDIEERSGGAKGVDIEPLRYHCVATLVARGGKTLEALGLQAVLHSASGVTGISERLLERLKTFWGRRCLATEVWAVPGINGQRPHSYGAVSDNGRPAGDTSGPSWAYQFPGGFCNFAWFG